MAFHIAKWDEARMSLMEVHVAASIQLGVVPAKAGTQRLL